MLKIITIYLDDVLEHLREASKSWSPERSNTFSDNDRDLLAKIYVSRYNSDAQYLSKGIEHLMTHTQNQNIFNIRKSHPRMSARKIEDILSEAFHMVLDHLNCKFENAKCDEEFYTNPDSPKKGKLDIRKVKYGLILHATTKKAHELINSAKERFQSQNVELDDSLAVFKGKVPIELGVYIRSIAEEAFERLSPECQESILVLVDVKNLNMSEAARILSNPDDPSKPYLGFNEGQIKYRVESCLNKFEQIVEKFKGYERNLDLVRQALMERTK